MSDQNPAGPDPAECRSLVPLAAGDVARGERRAGDAGAIDEPQVAARFRSAEGGEDGLPVIRVGNRQLRDITEEAVRAIAGANNPPRVFRRGNGGGLYKLRVEADTDRDDVVLSRLAGKFMRNHLSLVADWYRAEVASAPPADVVQDLEASTGLFSDIPMLGEVVRCPVVSPSGHLVTHAGYSRSTATWYQPDPGFDVGHVPASPSAGDVMAAVSYLDDELLGDFPFGGPPDRAVAWAVMLLPFVRALIAGPTPLHVIEAPTPGSGKNLLVQVLLVPALGRRPVDAMTADCEENEMRKRLTARLRGAPAVVLIDNLGQARRLESSSLSSVLSADRWADRIIGSSDEVSVSNRSVWVATGNNPRLSNELARRTVSCRLDPGTARPHMRAGFRHPALREWALDHRTDLVRALLTVIRAWLSRGRPTSDVKLGSFEEWARVIGGLLSVAGKDAELRRSVETYQGRSTDAETVLAPFFIAWWAEYGETPVGVRHLVDVAERVGCLESVMDAHLPGGRHRVTQSERSYHTRFGLALQRLTDQVYAHHRIRSVGTDRSGRRLYRLEWAESSDGNATVAGTSAG